MNKKTYKKFNAIKPIILAFVLFANSVVIATPVGSLYAQNNATDFSSSSIEAVNNINGTLGDIIPNEWIVTYRDNATNEVLGLENQISAADTGVTVTAALPEIGVAVLKTNESASSGFALADVNTDPSILAIEPNRVVEPFAQTIPTGIDRVDAEPSGSSVATTSS